MRSEIIDIVLDAVVVASEPVEVISEMTEIGVDAQVTAALSINMTVLFLPAIPFSRSSTCSDYYTDSTEVSMWTLVGTVCVHSVL